MPTITCPCGYVHDLSPIPDAGYRVISDRDYDTHRDDIAAGLAGDRNAFGRTLGLWTLLYECRECGRLAWWRDRSSDAVMYYRPEQLG